MVNVKGFVAVIYEDIMTAWSKGKQPMVDCHREANICIAQKQTKITYTDIFSVIILNHFKY